MQWDFSGSHDNYFQHVAYGLQQPLSDFPAAPTPPQLTLQLLHRKRICGKAYHLEDSPSKWPALDDASEPLWSAILLDTFSCEEAYDGDEKCGGRERNGVRARGSEGKS